MCKAWLRIDDAETRTGGLGDSGTDMTVRLGKHSEKDETVDGAGKKIYHN